MYIYVLTRDRPIVPNDVWWMCPTGPTYISLTTYLIYRFFKDYHIVPTMENGLHVPTYATKLKLLN